MPGSISWPAPQARRPTTTRCRAPPSQLPPSDDGPVCAWFVDHPSRCPAAGSHRSSAPRWSGLRLLVAWRNCTNFGSSFTVASLQAHLTPGRSPTHAASTAQHRRTPAARSRARPARDHDETAFLDDAALRTATDPPLIGENDTVARDDGRRARRPIVQLDEIERTVWQPHRQGDRGPFLRFFEMPSN